MKETEQFEITALREIYAALNAGDVDGFVANFDPQIERVEWPESPSMRSFHGIDAVKVHVSDGRGTWAEGGCHPERFMVAGDKIVVLVHVHVRLKEQIEFLDGRVADVFTWRDGKIVQFYSFTDEKAALEFVKEPHRAE